MTLLFASSKWILLAFRIRSIFLSLAYSILQDLVAACFSISKSYHFLSPSMFLFHRPLFSSLSMSSLSCMYKILSVSSLHLPSFTLYASPLLIFHVSAEELPVIVACIYHFKKISFSGSNFSFIELIAVYNNFSYFFIVPLSLQCEFH